jgi:hypothetical protein
MRLRVSSGASLAALLALVVVACGGTASNLADGGTDGGTDAADAGDTSDAGGCTVADLPGARACVPPTALAGEPIRLTVDAANDCLGCFTTVDACNVILGSHVITLSMVAKACPPPGDAACSPVCALAQTLCTVPPLGVGTYVVKVAGEPATSELTPRELVVTKTATDTVCTLAPPDAVPNLADLSTVKKDCGADVDCVLVTDGNLCQPCRCPNVAVSKIAWAYQSGSYRALRSQCIPDKSGVQCAACPPARAVCVIDAGAPSGTCTIK